MSDSETTRILLVDDHPVVRDGLAAIINRQRDMIVVAEAESGAEAVSLFCAHRPDVVLMDLRLPGMSGVGAISEIRKAFPTACIMVLTTFDGDEDIHRALDAGARGYLLKGMRREELIEAIRTVRSGRRLIPAAVAARIAEFAPRCTLTRREAEVLGLVAKGLSNKEAAAALGLTEGTVKAYLGTVLRKLGARDRTEAVVMALERGIIQQG